MNTYYYELLENQADLYYCSTPEDREAFLYQLSAEATSVCDMESAFIDITLRNAKPTLTLGTEADADAVDSFFDSLGLLFEYNLR